MSRRIALCLLSLLMFVSMGMFESMGRLSAGPATAGLVDINRATISELRTLPGIEDAYASAIAKNRPYKNKTQLLTRKIIPVTVYGRIKGRIIAKQ